MKKKWWVLILAIILVLGSSIFYLQKRSKSEQVQKAASWAQLQILPVQTGSITREIESSGTISGARQAELGFGSSGKIQRIYVEVGQSVEKGQILAEMDRTQQELALMRAQNAYDLALISGTTNAQKEAELDLKVAKTNLENTTIRAPFAGVVTEVNLEEGEQTSANTTVISLLDNSVFYADIAVDELDMHQIRLGQKALVKVDALGDGFLEGTVAQIGMIAQSTSGITTVPVTIRIEEKSPDLKVGYSASVIIEVDRVDNVLKVPVEAIVREGNRSYVTVVKNGEHVPVEVNTGLSDGISVEVTSGLNPEDQIVGFNFSLYDRTRNPAGSRMGTPGIRMGGFR